MELKGVMSADEDQQRNAEHVANDEDAIAFGLNTSLMACLLSYVSLILHCIFRTKTIFRKYDVKCQNIMNILNCTNRCRNLISLL